MSLRKVTKTRSSFPNDEAVLKLLYLALRNIAKKWTMPIHDWTRVDAEIFHDFHHGPADLVSGHFYGRRQREFDECLSQLESGRYRQIIWRTFKQKWGVQSPFVRWQILDKTLVQWALDCFPTAHLRLWFEWIVRDVSENRAGFPDLVQFWPEERKYRMIEVKGPGDRVQDNQRRLLEYCASYDIPVAVCYARWSAST